MDEKKGPSMTTGAQEKPVKIPSSIKTLTPDPHATQKITETEAADQVTGKTAAREKSEEKKELASAQKEMKAGADLEKDIFDEISSQFDQLFPEEQKGKPTQKPSGKIAKKEPIFQSVFNELEDGKPPQKDQKKPPQIPPEKKEYVIPYAADESKKEPPPKTPPKPPLIPKKKKPEKITVDTKDSKPKPQIVPPTKKKVVKPLLPAQETPKARQPAKADKKKEDQAVYRKMPMEKIGVIAVQKKSFYKAYVLLGAPVFVGIVIALLLFGPAQLFKKKETYQKRTTQKTIKMPLKPQVKKVVPVKKKSVVSASPSVKIKERVPSLKPPEKRPVPVKKKPVVPTSRSIEIKDKALPPKKLPAKVEKSGRKIAGIQTATRAYPHSASYPYSIHTGSFRSIQLAQQTVKDYRIMGLQAFWVRVDLGEKGIWYRVFSGCYKDLESAQKTIKAKQLKDAKPKKIKYGNFIGTYSSEENLRKQNQSLSKYGYAPYYIKDDQGKFHLFVGAFYTAKGAKKLSAELSSKGIRSQVVER